MADPMTARTLIGVEAHRLLSSSMRRALAVLARDHRAYVAPAIRNDLVHAQLVIRDRAGRIHLTHAGLRIAEDLAEVRRG